MRRFSTTLLAVLATAVTSAVATAQTPPVARPRPNRVAPPVSANRDSQPPRARRAGPTDPNRGLGGPASNLLRMREQLELTDDQVKKLESLQLSPRAQPNAAEMLRARADLMDATKGDVNLEKARAAFDRMARVKTDAQLAQLKSRQELRNVLTLGQRAKLDAFGRSMRDGRGAAMRSRANRRMEQGRRQRPGGPATGLRRETPAL